MRTHTTFKRRLLSAALALIMTGSLLPAGVFTPSAKAGLYPGPNTLEIHNDGSWTATFTGGDDANTGDWVIAVLPDVQKDALTKKPSEHPRRKFTTEAGASNPIDKNGLVDVASAAPAYSQVIPGSGTPTTGPAGNKQFTVSGTFGKSFKDLQTDYPSAIGTHTDMTSIPYVAIFYAPNGAADWSYAYANWEATAEGELDKGAIVKTGTTWNPGGVYKSDATGSENMSCLNEPVKYLGYSVSVSDKNGTVYTDHSGEGSNESVVFDSGAVAIDGNFSVGTDHVVQLNLFKLKDAKGNSLSSSLTGSSYIPITGVITVSYRPVSASDTSDPKTHSIPVRLGTTTTLLVVSEGKYTVKQNKKSSWRPLSVPTVLYGTNKDAEDGIGAYAGTKTAPPDGKNWVQITAPLQPSDSSIVSGVAVNPGASDIKISTASGHNTFTVGPLDAIVAQDPGTYTTQITYDYMYRSGTSSTTGKWQSKQVTIPITIIVEEGEATPTLKVTYTQPTGDGALVPAGISTPAATTGLADVNTKFDLPTYSSGDIPAHWTFKGWKGASATIDPSTTPKASIKDFAASATGDITVEAVWEYQPQYTITYDLNDVVLNPPETRPDNASGDAPKAQSGDYTASAKATLADTTGFSAPTGYKFAGWSTNKAAKLGDAGIYAASSSQTVSELTGKTAGNGDYTVTLYAIWVTPAEIRKVYPDDTSKTYKGGESISLGALDLSDTKDADKGHGLLPSSDRWKNNVVIEAWAVGNSMGPVPRTQVDTSENSYTIPGDAKDGDVVWVKVSGKGSSTPPVADDIAQAPEEERWFAVTTLGAAKAQLTAKVVYYNAAGSTTAEKYPETKPASVKEAAKINGAAGTFTGEYIYPENITLTTTHKGGELEFVGWTTHLPHSPLSGDCSHSTQHHIILSPDLTDVSINIHMDNDSAVGAGTGGKAVATTIYAVYQPKKSATLTVKKALKGASSTAEWTGADAAHATIVVSPASATTDGLYGGASAHVTASIDNNTYDYKFVGWMKDNGSGAPDNTLITTDGTTAAAAKLSDVSVASTGGMGAATFTMPDTPAATTIFAVYEAIPTRELTIEKDAGIDSVKVILSRGGTPTEVTSELVVKATAGDGTITYEPITVRATDTITVESGAKENFVVNGFDVTGNCTSSKNNSSVTLVLDKSADVTVLAKSKKGPPALTLTATNGEGTQVVSGTDKTTNTTTHATVSIKNADTSKAVVQTVTLGGPDKDRFKLPTSGLGNASNETTKPEIAANGAGSIIIDPDNDQKDWEARDYYFSVTITYTNPDHKDAEGKDITYTKTVEVKYTLSEDANYTGKVTVKLDGAAAYTSGNTAKTATVQYSTDSGTNWLPAAAAAVNSSGEYSVNLDKPAQLKVNYNGKTYTVSEQLSKSNPNVTVDLYTVTIDLANDSATAGALGTSSGKSPKLTLKVTDQAVSGNTATADQTASSKSSVSVVVQKGKQVKIEAAPGTGDNALNTGYSFDKWANGKFAADGNLTGEGAAPTALDDIGSTPYTFTVQGTTVYTAKLRKASYNVLTFDDNHAKAPNVAGTVTSANVTNMPSSQVSIGGEKVNIPDIKPVLPGYKFVGWSTDKDRGAAWDADAASDYAAPTTGITLTGDMTLYAVWEDDAITLTVPTVTDGVYGSNYNLGLTATASSGAVLSYAVDNPPAGLAMSGASLTGIPQTTGKDNSGGTAIEDGYANRAFTPTITVTLGSDYHATGHEVKAILQVDGTNAAATTSNNTKTYHTAKKLTVEKAQPKVTGIAISNVTAGGALNAASYTVSVTGPRYENAGWNFAYTEAIEYVAGTKTAGKPGTVAFASNDTDTSKFKASGATTVTATFTPEAADIDGKTSADSSYTSFDAYDADHHKNLQSHVWLGAIGTQSVTPGVSNGEMKVKLGGADDSTLALAKSWTYQTNATPPKNAHKGYTASSATTGANVGDGYVVVASGTETVYGKTFTLKNTGSIATGALTYEFSSTGTATSSYFTALSAPTGSLVAKTGTADVLVGVKSLTTPGTYTDTLTISNATSGVSVSIFLSFTVDDPMTYDAYVTVNTQAPGGVKTAKTTLPSGLGIATTTGSFTAVQETSGDHNGEYKISGLSVGTTYQLKVTGTGAGAYTVPGVSLSYTAANPTPTAAIDLYQVAYETHKDNTDHDATETTDATYDPDPHTNSGAGWYVDGQYATMTAHNGYSVTASGTTTNYVFSEKWTKSVTDTDASAASTPTEGTSNLSTAKTFTTAITQPTTFYAHYKVKDAATVTLHYEPNSGTDAALVPADDTQTLNASGNFTISTTKPTRTGYVFKNWVSAVKADGTKADGATEYAIGATGPKTASDATVYAIWVKAGFTGDGIWTETLPDGVYGESYAKQITIPGATDSAAVTVTAQWFDPSAKSGAGDWVAGLPGGLKLDPDTGLISGKPYMVSEGHSNNDIKTNGFKVKFTATHSVWSSGSDAVTESTGELRLKVAKHPVTLTGTSVTNVVAGQAVTTGNYETTVVTLPLYNGKDTDGVTDKWTTFTETVHIAKADADVGTLSITTDGDTTFSATTDTTVDLKYTPTSDASKGKDAHNNVHSAIYQEATTSIKAPGGGADYSMKIKLGGAEDSTLAQSKSWTYETNETPAKNARVDYELPSTLGDTGYVTRATTAGAADTVDAKKFVLKNTGNQATGTLTYTFGSGANTAFEVDSANTATVAAGATRDVLVKVKEDKAPGTYTDTLVITNEKGVSVSAVLKFTVEKANVDVAISTYLWDVDDTLVSVNTTDYPNTKAPTKTDSNSDADKNTINGQKAQITGGTVKLVDINDPTKTVTASWNATDKVYTASIDYDTTYNLVINGYTVPGVTFSRTKTAGGAYLYQVKTDFSPNATGNMGATEAPKVANSTGDASAATANAATNSIYVVVGEVATVTEQNKQASGFNYKEIQDTTDAAAPVTKTNARTYTTVVNAPMKFTAVYTKGYTLTYAPNGANWVSHSATAATDVAEAVESGAVTVKAPGVLTKTDGATTYTGFAKANYTFKGWSTSASTTPADWDTIYKETGHTKGGVTVYAAGDSINISADATLYAVWEPVKDGLDFKGETIKVAHYDKLADKVVAATGSSTFTYARTEDPLATLPGGKTGDDPNITFNNTDHKFTSGDNTVRYDAETTTNNSATTTVTATADNGAKVSADFTIEVVQAGTAITESWTDVADTVKAGDAFDFTKLTMPDGKTLTVSAYKTDGTTVNEGVDFDEAPTAANGATGNAGGLGGQWTVTKPDGTAITEFLPGTNDYVVTFTPNDEGFKPCSKTITLTLEKLIQEVTVSLTFPVDGAEPSKTATIENTGTEAAPGKNTSVIATDASPEAIHTDAVVVGDVVWAGTWKKNDENKDTFDRTGPITATVTVRPNTTDGWKFVTGKTGDEYNFKGNFSDLGTETKADKDVPNVKIIAMSENGESVTLQYTWKGEDTAASNIKIKVIAPTDGGSPNSEATPVGTPLGSFVTTDKDDNYTTKWYKAQLDAVTKDNYNKEEAAGGPAAMPATGEGSTFKAGETYVVIVTATATDGYYFNSSKAGDDVSNKLAALNEKNGYATINNQNAKVLAVEEVTDNNKRATKVTLAVEFTVEASEVVGLAAEDAKLDYYVMTDSTANRDLSAALTNDKHHNTNATGHNSGYGFTLTTGTDGSVKMYAINNKGEKTLTTNVVFFVDGEGAGAKTGTYDEGIDTLLSVKTLSGADNSIITYSTPGYTFTPKSAADLTSALDGKTLYAANVTGNGTTAAAIDNGTAGTGTSKVIAVGTLHVKPLEAKSIACVNNWSVDANKKFQIVTGASSVTDVTFNTGDAMANTVATVSYAARAESLATSVTAPVAAADTTKTRPSYYYMLDVGGNGSVADADDVELKANTDVSTYGGKSVYICYTDVNGHLVTAHAGVIGANFTVDIDDENGQQPEYGDKLTGEPKKPDGSDATPSDSNKPFTYQWEKKVGDDWKPIDGATSPEYVPGKDDVGDDIRVSVTDPGTGTTVPSAPKHIEKRSINFDVAAVDKRYDGDCYNDDHAYTTADFTAKRVEKVWNKTTKQFDVAQKDSVNTLFGGLLLGDAVTIAPYDGTSGASEADWNDVETTPAGMADKHHTSRPTYQTYDTVTKKYVDNPAVGSQIRWPRLLDKDTVISGTGDGAVKQKSHAVDATDGYTLGGADEAYYRLVPQDAMMPRGEITDGTVTHVDVSFKEWPTYDHLIPGTPMGVTDERETMAGEKAHTDTEANRQDYVANWYKVADGKTFDPSDNTTYTAVTTGTAKFESGAKYAVAVTVKPQTGYSYELDETKNPYTRFYFHFGEYASATKVEVSDNDYAAGTAGKGVWKHDVSGEAVYTMYCTLDEVSKPDIAYVNVTIPQPVAEVVRANTLNVIQVIGTDNQPIDTDNVTGAPTWEYVSATAEDGTKTWTAATANNGLDKDNKFLAEKQYRVTFTLTAGGGYKYLYTSDTTPKGINFVASGEGEIANANINGTHTWDGNSVINKEIIESVVTSAASEAGGKTAYTVTITYKPVKSGKADLMDVVVEASAATQAGVTKTGPEVNADKPYALDATANTASNKWFYWDGSDWAAASANTGLDKDGKFLAGYDYRVEGTVKLTDTTHYQITNKTKFYIAGYEVKTTDEVELHNTTSEKALTANGDGTYTLVKTFSIPAEDIDVVSVTHNLPLLSGATVPQNPDGWSDSAIVTIATNSDEWVKLGTDYDTIKDTLFTATGTAVNEGADTFVEDTYYRVTSTISPKANSGYQFKTGSTETDKAGNTVVVINGVAVNVDGNPGEVKNGKGETIAYVKATYDSANKVVKAMLVAKVQSDAINPIELKQDKIVPTTGADIPTDVFKTLDPDEPDYEVDTGKHNDGKGTWEYLDTAAKDDDHPDGTWKAVNTATKAGLDENGKFLGDTTYRVTVGVKVKGDKVFAANGVTKGSVTVGSLVYNAKPVTVAEDADNLTVHRKTADLTITFSPTDGDIKNVSHVDVSFREVPTFSHNALPVMGVTDARETQRGEASGDEQTYTATWYEGTPATDFDPTAPKNSSGNALTAWEAVTGSAAGTKTYGANTYTVVVQVKPKDGYRYALTADDEKDLTRFYFHFGEDRTVEVNTAAATGVVKGLKEDSGVYYMWYTFTVVDLPKIAYVNVSIPQPVAEVAPATALNVIQVIGTDNQPIDTDNVTGTPTWEYLDTSDSTWKTAAANAGYDANGKFLAETQYRVNFTLTAGGGYEYLYTDANKGIRFVASGEGELADANIDGDHTLGTIINTQIIESVVTSDADADTAKSGVKKYNVTITYQPVKSGKADLMDVVVEASAATQAGVTKTGPTVTDKPYALDATANTTSNKWFYWDGSNWAAVVVDADNSANNKGVDADGKFLAGYDYRVEGKVKLTDATHYRITDNTTKFYIAGYEVKTTDNVEHHNTTGETAVTADKPAVGHIYPADTVFTLVKTFSIPKAKTSAEIIITYPEPEVGKEPLTKRESTLWTYEYLSANVAVAETHNSAATPKTDGTTWYVTKLTSDPTQLSHFATTGLDELSATGFTYGTYYMVQGVIKPDDDHDFPEGKLYVTINGVRVEVDGAMNKKYDADGKNEIGWAMAESVKNGDGKVTAIKARYIAKTEAAPSNTIYKVIASVVTEPSVNGSISDQVDLEEARFDNEALATTNVSKSTVTWSVSDKADGTGYTAVTTTNHPDGKFQKGKYYKAEFTVWANDYKKDDGYRFENKDTTDPADGTPDDFVAFRINGVKKTGIDIWGINDKQTPDEAEENGIKVKTEQVKDDDYPDGNPHKYKITVWFPLNGELDDDLTVIGLTGTPAHNQTAGDTFIKVKDGEPYQIKDNGGEVKSWEHWTDADGWKPMTDGESFQAGEYYRAVMLTVIKESHKNLNKFTTKTRGEVNEEAARTVTGNLPTDKPKRDALRTSILYNNVNDNGEADSITLAQEFRVERTQITVHVSSEKPAANVYAKDMDVKIYRVDENDDHYTLDDGDSVKGWWYARNKDTGAYVKMGDYDCFEAGETYYLFTNATAEEAYCFINDVSGFVWVENKSTKADMLTNKVVSWDGDLTYARAMFEYTIAPPSYVNEIPGNVKEPVQGQPLDRVGWGDSNFTPIENGVTWYDGTVDKTTAKDHTPITDTNAKEETTYTAAITVKPNEGVQLAPDGSLTYKFNGEDITANVNEYIYNEADGTYTLFHTFPPTGKKDVIHEPGGGGGSVSIVESPVVYYHLKDQGVTDDPTAEKVRKNSRPTRVPKVKAITGLKFLGWSEVDPGTLPAGKLPTLVDPTTFKITSDKWFYAVYEQGVEVDHLHYVIGFPNGTFGPDAKITRAEVATIIARSCLEGFVEGANYGNPGNYNDVSHHWAFSAIAFCAREGVFKGYEDGTFRPDRYITRQELATVVSRLAGIQTSKGVPFNDKAQIASWAMNGVYTAFANGWIKGYEDGTFQPERDISRAETVKIFNGYLKRGVDAKGLEGLKEYVHTGVASNNTENGHDEYMTWPDVPKTHWAYHEIIEAANDHNYHWQDETKKTPPEDWDEVYIDEKWRYNDNASDGADKRDENMNLQKTFTVTYLVSSNGVTYDAITETVERFSSPKPENMPIAVPNEGYRFAGWSSTDPSTGTVTLVDPTASSVTRDEWFYAVFEEDKPYTLPVYTVTYVIGEHGSYDGATVERVEMFQAPSLDVYPHPVAKEGYRFIGWSETDPANGGYTIMDPTANYITGDKTFYAVYEAV